MGADLVEPAKTIYQQAYALHQQGRLLDAQAAYERALHAQRHPAVLTMLGVIALDRGNPKAAIALLDEAVASGPVDAMTHIYHGIGHSRLGGHEAAVGCYDKAIAIDAESSALPHYNRANALFQLTRYEAAVEGYDRAIAMETDLDAECYFERGMALQLLQRPEAAITSFERAIALGSSRKSAAHFNRAASLQVIGSHDKALAAYEAAIQAKPDFGGAYAAAGALLQGLGQLEEAERMLSRGIERDPSHVYLRIDLGNVLKDGGRTDLAIDCYRKALQLDPNHVVAHSNLLFSLMYTSDVAEPILAECRRFNQRFAAPLQSGGAVARGTAPTPGKRLRIGYVSPDFRSHCQSLFTLPLLENHDHSAFEVFVYSSVAQPDGVTEAIKGNADVFRDVSRLNDEALAKVVRDDQVDILVDLSMHMAGGRPLLFARRPAPLQVAWLAYPGTTGIEAIDYRFSDPRLDPPGFETHYSERTIRLPDAFWCYGPRGPRAPTPGVNPLPAMTRGHLTLGCLNNSCKLTDRTLQLWAPLLRELPNARLLLMMPPGKYRSELLARARTAGIDESVVQFVATRPRHDYLNSYHDIDLCLDTLPYNGHTTTLDALWMGVPTVTRVGMTCQGRAGLSLLYQIGLTELAADTDEGFVSAAVALARDLPRLAALRNELRPRLESSPLMNGRRFAANIEAAYREMRT